MTELIPAIAAALLGAGITLAAVRWLVPRLPEPNEAPPDKIPYTALSGWPFAVGCAGLSAIAVGLGWFLVPAPARPLWVVLGTAALLLAAVDARTTWLPLRLTHAAWLGMGTAALIGAVWAGATDDAGTAFALLLRAAVGAFVGGGLYLLIWFLTRGGFGFGDVRFAPLVGAAAAAPSLSLLLWALTLGSLAGGLHGVVRLLRRRPGPFPYAPAMLIGAYLALAAGALSG